MNARRLLAAIFAVLLCAAPGADMAASYDDFLRAYLTNGRLGLTDADSFGNIQGGTDEQSALNELRRRYNVPDAITDAQVKQYFQENPVLGPQTDRGFGNAAMDFAGPGSVADTFARMIFMGPVGATTAAASGPSRESAGGPTQGMPLAMQYAIALAAAASGDAPAEGGDTPPPSGNAPSQNMQVAQGPSSTMTDVSGGLSNTPSMLNPNSGLVEDFATPQMLNAGQNVLNGLPPPPSTTTTTKPGEKDQSGAPATTTQPAPTTNPDGTQAPKPETSIADKFKTAANGLTAVGAAAGLLGAKSSSPTTQSTANALQETEAERQARILAATDAVNTAFAGYDDPYYSGIADAYKKYQMPLYDEQVTEARRKLPMSVPNTQSSAYQRRARQLETDVQRGQSQLDSDAIQQANARRGEIDFQKSDLMNMATAGADTASVADAAGQRAAQYAAPPQFSPIADMFQKYTADAANFALAGQANRGAAPTMVRPLTFSHSPSTSQRIIA
jgi:hypothetical protein